MHKRSSLSKAINRTTRNHMRPIRTTSFTATRGTTALDTAMTVATTVAVTVATTVPGTVATTVVGLTQPTGTATRIAELIWAGTGTGIAELIGDGNDGLICGLVRDKSKTRIVAEDVRDEFNRALRLAVGVLATTHLDRSKPAAPVRCCHFEGRCPSEANPSYSSGMCREAGERGISL